MRIEPIPFNQECLEELERIQADLARSMDDMILQTFLAASRPGPPTMTRTVEARSLTIQDIRNVYDRLSTGHLHLYEPVSLPMCAQCGKSNLRQSFTSTRDQREICADCFEGLQDNGLAREQGQPLKKKARHPLDAWMGEQP